VIRRSKFIISFIKTDLQLRCGDYHSY